MRKKTTHASAPWTRLGGPPAGSVAALAAVQTDVLTVFAGTQVGVFRLEGGAEGEPHAWERLPGAPLGVLALAAAPDFAGEPTLIAGTHTGIFVSRDAGETWQASELPISHPTVIALSFSPNYLVDGVVLAGTMEDGVFFSNSRGARWQTSGFGLLDATFYCVGFSPNFTQDATVFTGTDTTVYHSTNGAAAWRQLDFPEEAAPALSLAVSPNFGADGTVFVGSESQGLYRSTNRGRTWDKLSLPAECVNALLFAGPQQGLLAATESGIFASPDLGNTWSRLLDQPNAISLAAAGDLTVAGVVNQGVVLVTAAPGWESLPSLSARSVLGLVLSPQYAEQPVAFMYGPQEGVWRSTDGGRHWESLGAGLPSADILALVLAPDFASSQAAVAATPTGLLVSRDGGSNWLPVTSEGATLAAFSPDGRRLIASLASGSIRGSDDLGATWQPMPGPWEAGGKVVALALDEAGDLYVAVLEGLGRTLSLWHGRPGDFEKVLSREVAENPVVSLFLPAGPTADRAWYAACGNTVWKLSARRGRQPAQSIVFPNDTAGASIVALTGAQNETGQVLMAGTGQHIFKLVENKAWKAVHDFGTERALALVLSPHYAADKTVYGLLLGGMFCQGLIR
jgi:photosystem II stability/assembly factor-like uncharacterized protein